MPVAVLAITHSRDRGHAENKKIIRSLRYQLLLCGVLIMTIGHNTVPCHHLEPVQQNLCEFPKRVTGADIVVNATLNNVIEKATEFEINPRNNRTMEDIQNARDWEEADDTDPTKRTKNIKHQQEVSLITNAVLRDLTLNKDEASKIFNDAAYKTLLDLGIYSSF